LTAAFAALLAVGVLTYADGAKADPYRWCAQYGTSDDNGTNCYFVTLDHCRAAISGNGGFCTPNNFYDGTPVSASEGAARRSHSRSRPR
jgi:hypothetical protein